MNEHVVIGMHETWGQEQPLILGQQDRRQHLYTVGKSGVGKTTLLRNLILQDILAGHGVAAFDPHGDMLIDLLDYIPSDRIEDVVYFDPADMEFPIGFNILGHVRQDRRHLVASGIVSAFKSIWPEFWGPRTEYILYAAVAAILDCENVSLLGVQRMLSDKRYRAWVVKQIKDPIVRSFWVNEFERYETKFRNEVIAPLQNKIGQMLMSPQIRNILGQIRSRIDARYMMENRKIFLANLSKGRLGADKASLIGALLIVQFQIAAMARADIAEPERQDFYLYVDEFHAFSSDAFISILSEARKYRLCLTLSHQYTDQLRPEIRDAVFGNVGSMIAFRVGHNDAKVLEQAFGEAYSASEFSRLSNGHIFAKLLSDGQDREPYRGKTHPPIGKRYGRRDAIIKRSREKYSLRRDVIERKIKSWMC